jgi:hypothetical protein
MDTEQTTDVRELSDDALNLVAGGLVNHWFWLGGRDGILTEAFSGSGGRGQDVQAA